MKKIFTLILLGFTVISFAQGGNSYKQMHSEFTPEQQVILHTKNMALKLDLNAVQQKQFLALNKKASEARKKTMAKRKSMKESGKQLSSDERFEMKNKMLDSKLKHQAEVKKILNEKQYEQWRKLQGKKHKMHKKSLHKHRSY